MAATGTSRGYNSDPEDDQTSASPYEMHQVEDLHEAEHEHEHHAAPLDPNWIVPSDSTLDDVYITSGGKVVDPGPIGGLAPWQVIDKMTPPPHAYSVDWVRLAGVCFWATMVFTPIWYCLYFGYRDSCFDLGLVLGAWFDPALDWGTRLIGLVIHFGISFGFAAVYAYLLIIFRTQSTAGRGVQYGIGIWFAMCTFGLTIYIATVARWAIGAPQFDVPDLFLQQAGPANLGYEPLLVALIAHLFYGVILGGLYKNKVLVRQSDTVPAFA